MIQCPNEPNIIVAMPSSVEVHPVTPDLPILRRAVFRVIHPAWTEALIEARARIDALLR